MAEPTTKPTAAVKPAVKTFGAVASDALSTIAKLVGKDVDDPNATSMCEQIESHLLEHADAIDAALAKAKTEGHEAGDHFAFHAAKASKSLRHAASAFSSVTHEFDGTKGWLEKAVKHEVAEKTAIKAKVEAAKAEAEKSKK